jgi:antitoxin ParD1/3/4
MAKNTSIFLGKHFEGFIADQLQHGRYGSASKVLRASLRLLEEHEQKVEALRQALIEGELRCENSPLDMSDVVQEAKREAGLNA